MKSIADGTVAVVGSRTMQHYEKQQNGSCRSSITIMVVGVKATVVAISSLAEAEVLIPYQRTDTWSSPGG